MISFGIDVNCRHNGKTPVCLVAHTGQMEMLELLIATEADLNKPDMLGKTYLFPVFVMTINCFPRDTLYMFPQLYQEAVYMYNTIENHSTFIYKYI